MPSAASPDGAKTEHALPFAPPSTARARALLDGFLESASLGGRCRQEAIIVLGELVSNALDHGSPMQGDCFEVAFELTPDGLVLTVCDGGANAVPRVVNAGPYAPRGRGLAMVQALCRDWTVERVSGTKVRAILSC